MHKSNKFRSAVILILMIQISTARGPADLQIELWKKIRKKCFPGGSEISREPVSSNKAEDRLTSPLLIFAPGILLILCRILRTIESGFPCCPHYGKIKCSKTIMELIKGSQNYRLGLMKKVARQIL
eukprot:Gregarina_sp_Poly_1__3850@NODE_2149_length_2598_cov_16_449230_g1384_i0_p2_GENE_NODE_2149_length_2598_cov_16_449230_g1384_i0NODE_2149_length_2598_cov_16_449230_g1384_i0_p2_ORF_typecomplete_len126_score3_52_NODE_2149_length_2598_cov_16_449230_g1384_i039416